jgi:hypothetical protein
LQKDLLKTLGFSERTNATMKPPAMPLDNPALEKLNDLVRNVGEICEFLQEQFCWFEDDRIPHALVAMAEQIDAALLSMERVEGSWIVH